MSDLQKLETVLRKTARRRRWQEGCRGLVYGLLAGGLMWLLVLGVYKLFPIPMVALWVAGLAGLSLIPAGLIWGWSRPRSLLEIARWVDQKEGLQERLSTAWELAQRKLGGPWEQLCLHDAARAAESLDPKHLLPIHLPRAARWATLVLTLGAGLGFVPEYRSKHYVQQQLEKEIIQDTGRHLAELTRRNLQQRAPALDSTRTSMESVAELGDKMQKAQLTRNEALKDLANAMEKVREQARELAKNPALKSMEKAARNQERSGNQSRSDLQKQADDLQKSLGNQAADSKALQELQKDLQKAKETAAGMASQDSAEAQAAKEKLAEALSELARRAQEMGLSLAGLDEAMAALEASQTDQLLRDLEFAENNLDQLLDLAKQLEQMQARLEKMGKDLGEQLARGQADAARATLQKMAQELQSASLDPENLEKLLEEVNRAVDPATPYGKVSELLKQAAQQMKAGQKGEASKSLAEAAKELDELMNQLADMEGLMASLQALQTAQMCVGNCQSWGNSQGPPRAGQGKRPGAGVGTWGDDSLTMDPSDVDAGWDNSGVVRPDQEGRGVTERQKELNADFQPDRVRGQMSPGGPMPSITLKGVSIKGMSRVEFQEKAATAQQEAQSALNQEQVPRAYQNTVRDYFDDLK